MATLLIKLFPFFKQLYIDFCTVFHYSTVLRSYYPYSDQDALCYTTSMSGLAPLLIKRARILVNYVIVTVISVKFIVIMP
jgi:hypothetical protein